MNPKYIPLIVILIIIIGIYVCLYLSEILNAYILRPIEKEYVQGTTIESLKVDLKKPNNLVMRLKHVKDKNIIIDTDIIPPYTSDTIDVILYRYMHKKVDPVWPWHVDKLVVDSSQGTWLMAWYDRKTKIWYKN